MRVVPGIVGVLLAAIVALCLYAATRADHFYFSLKALAERR